MRARRIHLPTKHTTNTLCRRKSAASCLHKIKSYSLGKWEEDKHTPPNEGRGVFGDSVDRCDRVEAANRRRRHQTDTSQDSLCRLGLWDSLELQDGFTEGCLKLPSCGEREELALGL